MRVPDRGAAPLEALEEALAAVAADAPHDVDPALIPFVEAALTAETAEPDLRARLEAAIGDAPLRLTRILRVRRSEAGEPAPMAEDLAALNPEAAFARLHQRDFGAPPPADLAAALRTLLAEDGDAEPAETATPAREGGDG